mgnify:CR=1 FL=1
MTVFHFWLLVVSRLCYLSLTRQDANETTTSTTQRPSSPAPSAVPPVTVIVTVLQERFTEGGSSSNWLVVLLFIISLVLFITSTVLLLQKYKIWSFTDGTGKRNIGDIESKRMAEYRKYISKLGKEAEINTALKRDAPTTAVTLSVTPASSAGAPKETSQSISGSVTSSAAASTKSTEVTATTSSTPQPSPSSATSSTPQTSTPTVTSGQPLVTVIVTGDQIGQTQNIKTVTKSIKSESDDDKLAKVGKSASKVFQNPESVERFYSISEAKAKGENREKSEII